ncbi:DNA-binding transcriptional regulator, FadR family [Brevibacterium siliguriense]|uniref:DNA-binding transcriptional regulator, FadR family n=1 Tax=Brevibacterium siliguriense TaxID=1136497 RepID=A0A1H1XSI9_9MICO|nr:GntR family transcriptional regulator [Brevibacterium siliguriense]SDT12177.1 DNA-binding transcriptional regulator, FadR family [Brevibacterium siliguriense]
MSAEGVSALQAQMTALRAIAPARSGNVFEETIECLLQIIRLGIIPPGQRFPPERELADQLGISRATLREAISELQSAGWVNVRRGRGGGTFVTKSRAEAAAGDAGSGSGVSAGARTKRIDDSPGSGFSPEEVDDTLMWRKVIEIGIAEVAAAQDLTAAQRGQLASALDASRASDMASYRRLDSQLHLTWAQMTGSPSLVRSMVESRTRANKLLERIPMIEPNLVHSHEQHRHIHEAILAGDSEAARSAMAEHLDGTAALLRGFLAAPQ